MISFAGIGGIDSGNKEDKMEFLLNIFNTINTEDLSKKIIEISATLLIALITISAASYFSSKTSKHQKNILKLEHLKILKDLIDKRAYEFPAYRLIIEETLQSYIGYSINFETIKVLFRTEQPSYILSLYKDFRFNLKMVSITEGKVHYSHDISPWKYGLKKIFFFVVSLLICIAFVTAAIGLLAAFSVNNSASQIFVLSMLSIVFSLAAIAFFITAMVLFDRGLNYFLRQSQLNKMIDELNKASTVMPKLNKASTVMPKLRNI